MKTLLSAAALVVIYAIPAQAQPQCAPRPAVLKHLAENYGEARQSIGVTGENVMETFANTETGSWTIAVTLPNGLTCLVVAGEGFEALDEALEPAGMRL